MKKFALAMCAVLALSATASAGTATIGTSITVKSDGAVKSVNGDWAVTGGPSMDNGLGVTVNAKGDNWSGSADLGKLGSGNLAVGGYQFDAQDGAFKLTIWGNKEMGGDVKSPFAYVQSLNEGGNWKARAKYGVLTMDVEEANDTVSLYGEKGIGTLTLGGWYQTNMQGQRPAGQSILDGYVKTNVGPAALTGEVALRNQTGVNGDNSKLGVSADVKVTNDVQLYGKFESYAKNWDDKNIIVGKVTYNPLTLWAQATLTTNHPNDKNAISKTTLIEADQTKSNTKFYGSVSSTVDALGKNAGKATSFKAIYRANSGSDYDWYANYNNGDHSKYYSNKALVAGFYYDNSASNDADKALTTIAVKAATPIIPDKAWVVGAVELKSDEDATVTAASDDATDGDTAIALGAGKSSTKIVVNGRYILTPKVTLDGRFKAYSAGTDSYSQVYAKATYQMVSNLSLNGYVKQENASKDFSASLKKSVQTIGGGFSLNF